jgi:hypothetical protein
MKTEFHKKLEGMVRITRPEGHWFVTAGETVRLPSNVLADGGSKRQQIVTTKRAIYAAFVGTIPKGFEVVSTCEYKKCVAPDHQTVKFREMSKSHGISMPDQVEALKKPKVFQPAEMPHFLPQGMTLAAIQRVKLMLREGIPVRRIAEQVAMPIVEVMRIRGGMYEKAVENITKSAGRRGAGADDKPTRPETFPDLSAEDYEALSEEERSWLMTIK